MKQLLRMRLALLPLALLLGQCGGGAEPAPTAESSPAVQAQEQVAEPVAQPRTYVLGFCPKMLDNPVFNMAKIGAEKAAQELEPVYGKIEIRWSAPTEADAAKQVEILQGFVNSGVDGIAVSCNEPSALKPAIDAAVDVGIPTMTFDSDSPESKRITYYGTDDMACGALIAELLHKSTGGQGTYAILTGKPGAYNLETRMQGIEQKLQELGSGLKLIQKVYCEDDIAVSVERIEQLMRAHPDLSGWAMVGGWPLFTQNALAPIDPPGSCKVIAVDALPEMWPYLEQGYVEALLGQKIFQWGNESVHILMDNIVNKKQFSPNTWSGMDIVTKESLPEYKKKWNEWFGTDYQ